VRSPGDFDGLDAPESWFLSHRLVPQVAEKITNIKKECLSKQSLVVEVKDTEPNPDSEFNPKNIENKQIIKADPTSIFMTTKIQPKEPVYPEEGEHLFHSQMWVKGTPLHFIVDNGS
jgi:hypothetical protein